MKNFLAIYTGNPAAMAKWQQNDEATRARLSAAGIAAWHQWADEHKAAIVDMGAPVGKTKRVGPAGITDVSNNIGGYTVVRAETYQAAAELFLKHPHFTIFPGEAVEIMECMPIPNR